MSSDRRIFPRAFKEIPAWIQESGRSYRKARAIDLSLEGAQVTTDEPLSPGTRIVVEFELSRNWRVRADAEVVWIGVDEGGSGFLAGLKTRFQRRTDRTMLGPWIYRQAGGQVIPLERARQAVAKKPSWLKQLPRPALRPVRWPNLLKFTRPAG